MKYTVLLCCCIFVFLTGCRTTGAAVATSGTKLQAGVEVSEQELAACGEAYLRQSLNALATGDYEKFTEFYVNERKQELSVPIFEQMAAGFRKTYGEMKSLRYLGCVNKYSSQMLLWCAVFERTPAGNEYLKKKGYDPAAIPDTESLVNMIVGKTENGWKIIRMGIQ